MKINIRKKVYEVTNNDMIFECCRQYLLVSFDYCVPLPKRTFEKLKKENLIVLVKGLGYYITANGKKMCFRRYRFNVDSKGE